MKFFTILLVFNFLFQPIAFAREVEPFKKHELKTVNGVKELDHDKGEPFYQFYPFVPRKKEYNVELGSMWEKNTMYWMGRGCTFIEQGFLIQILNDS